MNVHAIAFLSETQMSDKKNDSIDPLDVAIAVLCTQRDQIDAAIAALKAVCIGRTLGEPAMAFGSAVAQKVSQQPESFLGMTISVAAKKLLGDHRRPLATLEIASALVEGGIVIATSKKVRSVLRREAQKGADIVSVGRGMWALTSWDSHSSYSQMKSGAEKEADDELLQDAVNALDAPGTGPLS
jgi:hypothetical protein